MDWRLGFVLWARVSFRPIADISIQRHLRRMRRVSTFTLCAVFLVAAASCAEDRRPTLNLKQAQQCQAKGGFESRAPFGTPICQFRYADAGKNCTGKADCLGRCLSDAPDNAASIQIGTPVAGRCEANASTFGCYARVEAGKLAESYSCED